MSFARLQRRKTAFRQQALTRLLREQVADALSTYQHNQARIRRAKLVLAYLTTVRGYDVDTELHRVWRLDLQIVSLLLWCERRLYGR